MLNLLRGSNCPGTISSDSGQSPLLRTRKGLCAAYSKVAREKVAEAGARIRHVLGTERADTGLLPNEGRAQVGSVLIVEYQSVNQANFSICSRMPTYKAGTLHRDGGADGLATGLHNRDVN